MNNENEILCDGCEFYKDKFFILKHKSGKHYCIECRLKMSNISPNDIRTISQEEFNRMLKIALSTPPLKLKDLKEQQKKEKEEKENASKQNSEDKKKDDE